MVINGEGRAKSTMIQALRLYSDFDGMDFSIGTGFREGQSEKVAARGRGGHVTSSMRSFNQN